MSVPITKFNLRSLEYRAAPVEAYGKLRELGAVIKIKMPMLGKAWAATSYASVSETLKNDEAFVRDPINAGKKQVIPFQWLLPRSIMAFANNMLAKDTQDHRRLRSVVDKAFAMRNIEAMSDRVETIANLQLDQVASVLESEGKVDLIEHYARPVPMTVICELLGLPEEDRPKFSKWFSGVSNVNSLLGIFKLGPSIGKLGKYLRNHVAEVRKDPRPGLVSNLVHAEHEGERLNDEELLSMILLLLAAGHETTVHLITNMLLSLEQFPSAKQNLISDWSKSDSAIEETLRYCSPIQIAKPRFIAQDMDFHGQSLKRGEMIIPLLASANYDPDRFEEPEKFDIDRERNYHMTFGSGPHVCLGMKLARTETHHAIKCLYDRFPNLKPDFDLNSPDWSKRIGMRGLKSFVIVKD